MCYFLNKNCFSDISFGISLIELLIVYVYYFYKVASVIAAMATWPFAGIRSIGWGWTGVIWVFNIVTYMLLDPIKFLVRYALSGKSWNRMVEQRVCIHLAVTLKLGASQ